MVKVTFGKNQIIYVEDISKYLSWKSSFIEKMIDHCKVLSVIREYYTEKPRLDLVYQMCDLICDHEDVYHVEIKVRVNNEDIFMKDLVNMMELCFNSIKSCTLTSGDKNMFYFRDGFSNPSLSLDDNFQIKENWDD